MADFGDTFRLSTDSQTVRVLICQRGSIAALLLFTFVLPFLPGSEFQGTLLDIWQEILLLVGFFWNILFLIRRARVRRAVKFSNDTGQAVVLSWSEAGLWNAAGLLLIFLHVQQLITSVVAWVLMISLRIGVTAGWLAAVLGFPIVCHQVLLRRTRPVSKWIKRWFSVSLLVLFAEVACLLMLSESDRTSPVTFPEHLSSPKDGSLHIAAIGGSTMLGWPWQPQYSIAAVAAWQLGHVDDHNPQAAVSKTPIDNADCGPQRIVLHNVARAGDGLRQDIEALQNLPVKPHVLLVYTGHNEIYHDVDFSLKSGGSRMPLLNRFLQWSPTFVLFDRLLTERFSSLWRIEQRERRLADDGYLSDDQRARRLATFTQRLKLLAEFCQRQRIRLVLFLPAGSESGCPPNRSVWHSDNRAPVREDCEAAYRVARKSEEEKQWNQAAEIYQRQLRGNPDMAEFHFRLGHCLLQLKNPERAASHFQSALETDGYPVRAQAEYRQVIEQIANESGAPLIHTAAILRPLTPSNILDESVFLDDVHPTLRATYAAGTATADVIDRLMADEFPWLQPSAHGSFRESLSALHADPATIAAAYDLMAGVMLNRAALRFDHSHWNTLADRLRAAAASLRNGSSLPDHTGIESLTDFCWPHKSEAP